MLEQITKKLTRLHGDSAGERDSITSQRDAVEGSVAATEQQPSSDLFRCPSCETVYIAYTKETCGTCRTDVTVVH